MKLLLIEQPLNNRGDESAHRGLITKIIQNYPNAQVNVLFWGRKEREINEFKVISNQVKYVNITVSSTKAKYYHRAIKAIMMLNLPRLLYLLPLMWQILKFYKMSDYVICAPGGMNLGGFQDWPHQAYLYLAMYEKKKIIYYGRSIGPFNDTTYLSRLFKSNSVRLLKYFKYISLRDSKSQLIAKNLGIEFIPTIDSAFLVDPNPDTETTTSILKEFNNNPYIVFVPNSLAWHKSFKSYSFDDIKLFWISLLNNLAKSYPNHKIVMLPQTIGHSKMLPDGYIYFNDIKNESDFPNQVFVLDEKYGSDIQQKIISNSCFVIGARYHSIIFSINQSIPFISLSYEHKMNGVVEIINKKDYEIDLVENFANLSMKDILHGDLIERIVNRTRELKPISDARKLAYEIANKGFDELKHILN